jgi:hypothetical protein
LFESRIVEPAGSGDARVGVQYRLVLAADAESAYQRALALGRREQGKRVHFDATPAR